MLFILSLLFTFLKLLLVQTKRVLVSQMVPLRRVKVVWLGWRLFRVFLGLLEAKATDVSGRRCCFLGDINLLSAFGLGVVGAATVFFGECYLLGVAGSRVLFGVAEGFSSLALDEVCEAREARLAYRSCILIELL